MEVILNCHLNVVAQSGTNLQVMTSVTSLGAAVAFYDRICEEGGWPEDASLWAVGDDTIFQYDPDVEKWIECQGLASAIVADSLRPIIN